VGWSKPVEKPKIKNGETPTLIFDLAQDAGRNSRTEIQEKYVMVNGVYT
jgi:hypothetical protein